MSSILLPIVVYTGTAGLVVYGAGSPFIEFAALNKLKSLKNEQQTTLNKINRYFLIAVAVTTGVAITVYTPIVASIVTSAIAESFLSIGAADFLSGVVLELSFIGLVYGQYRAFKWATS